jgi:low affinity Fe/Cu permease
MSDVQKKGWFACFAQTTATLAGSAPAFATAIGVVVIWAISGPLFHFSEVWQLVINTGTTIVTFLMVFLVQNAQNRDGKVIQLKLDELIRAVETANTAYIGMDDMSETELEALRAKYSRLAERARTRNFDLPKGEKLAHARAEAAEEIVALADEHIVGR